MKALKTFFFITLLTLGFNSFSQTSKIVTIDNDNFKTVTSKGIVVVDFWATWCGPCIQQGKVIDQLSEELSEKVVFGKINIDKNKQLANSFGIQYIPTTIIFVKGKPVDRQTGFQNKDALMQRLNKYIKQ